MAYKYQKPTAFGLDGRRASRGRSIKNSLSPSEIAAILAKYEEKGSK